MAHTTSEQSRTCSVVGQNDPFADFERDCYVRQCLDIPRLELMIVAKEKGSQWQA